MGRISKNDENLIRKMIDKYGASTLIPLIKSISEEEHFNRVLTDHETYELNAWIHDLCKGTTFVLKNDVMQSACSFGLDGVTMFIRMVVRRENPISVHDDMGLKHPNALVIKAMNGIRGELVSELCRQTRFPNMHVTPIKEAIDEIINEL